MTVRNYVLLLLVNCLFVCPGFSQEPIQSSVHLKDQVFNSGMHKFLAYDTITMSNVAVDDGVDLTLRSLNTILIFPGVNISQGASFQAYADMPVVSQLMDQGALLFNTGDYDGAIARYEQVLQIYPGHTLAHYYLAVTYHEKGEIALAIGFLEKVLLLATPGDPILPQTHYRLGLWKFPDDPYNFHFEKVLELVAPDDPLAIMVKDARINYHFNRGLSLLDTGDCNGAIMEFQRVLQIDPDHAQAHYRLGIAYVCTDQQALACIHLKRFIELAPDDPEAATAMDLLTYLDCN